MFIRNFYAKCYKEFTATEFENFDAFLNHIFLNLSKIDFSNIDGPEEHYVIKAIYYQCWNAIYQIKRERNLIVADNSTPVISDDGLIETAVERKVSDGPGPVEYLEASDLFTIINTFKITLKDKDLLILNALIDQRSLQEIAGYMRLDYDALCVKVKRLREKLARYLKITGYQNDLTRNFLRKNKKRL